MEQHAAYQREAEQGFVVWDRHGLVVRWPDGASQRFSWEALRHSSLCEACREQNQQHATLIQGSTSLTLSKAV